MKITLRRANAIQASIQEVLKSIDPKVTIDLDEFQQPSVAIHEAYAKLVSEDTRRADLIQVLYTIREKVGHVNNSAGIDSTLANLAFISKRIEQLAIFTDESVSQDYTTLEAKLTKISADTSSYYSSKTVTTGVMTVRQLDVFKKESQQLKKQKQKYNDDLLSLNITAEIDLDDNCVSVLTSENLI